MTFFAECGAMKIRDVFFTVLDVFFGIISLLCIFGGSADLGNYFTGFGFLFFGIADFLIRKYKR